MRRFVFVFAAMVVGCSASSPRDGDPIVDAGPKDDDGGAAADGGPSAFKWPVPMSPISIAASPYWKNSIARDDPFFNQEPTASGNGDGVAWVKFAVLMRDPTKVYFQDSREYPFHFDFATRHLAPFAGLDRARFDRVSLYETDQEVILGAVLFAPSRAVQEFGIQLVRQDAYHPEMVRIVFERVRAGVQASGARSFYFPTFEQHDSAESHRAWFLAQGIDVSSVGRWTSQNSCYSKGWALGRLVSVPGNELDSALVDGRLTHSDIVLTDGVPAEIPFVAGLVSLAPSTPNSHAALLAGNWGIPFVHLALDADRAAATALIGRQIILRARGGLCEVRLIDASELDAMVAQGLLAAKLPTALAITPKARKGAYSASVDGLLPSDIRYFGGKATNFSVLRAAIPEVSPSALAFSFDLWDAFMDQPLARGVTLRAAIRERLARHTWPPNAAELRMDLAEAERLIVEEGEFSPELRQAIETALLGFEPAKKIRFRSSTNVEDSAQLSGAGLYESYSGCLADDRDADDVGPSQCEAAQSKERGVFRAIKKVFASFYRENAFLERLRNGIHEDQVAMAVLVHNSFPDEDELANGVAIVERKSFTRVRFVSQAGAVSVANPASGARPEVVSASVFSSQPSFNLEESSSLVPLGGTVMTWQDDYLALVALMFRAADRWKAVTNTDEFTLDFEYKKIRGRGLVIKQVRAVPVRTDTSSMAPFLIDDGALKLCVYQGEQSDVFSLHRLKSEWSLRATEARLDAATLDRSVIRQAALKHVEGGQIVDLSGSPSAWPGASHRREAQRIVDSWRIDGGIMSLSFELPNEWDSAILTLGDLSFDAQVAWDQPVPFINRAGIAGEGTRTDDFARLEHCRGVGELPMGAQQMTRDVMLGGGKSVRTQFYWPAAPTGIDAGYTAPLERWVETTLSGWTSTPIVLRGGFAATYRPLHHNFAETFVFEPRLDPSVDAALVAELERAAIRLLFVEADQTGEVWVMNAAGEFRKEN